MPTKELENCALYHIPTKNDSDSDCLIILDGARDIDAYDFSDFGNFSKLKIPASIENIAENAFDDCPGLSTIYVDPANKCYASIDGILFNKEKTILIRCPDNKIGEYRVPESVNTIMTNAFFNCSKIARIKVQ